MTDAQIDKVLAQHKPIAAVLLARGGWMRAEAITIRVAFPAEEGSRAVWCIALATAEAGDEPWHAVYIEAENIVGISVVTFDSASQSSDRHQGAHQ